MLLIIINIIFYIVFWSMFYHTPFKICSLLNIICAALFGIVLIILRKRISKKTIKLLCILAPIWNIVTMLVILGFYLYNAA